MSSPFLRELITHLPVPPSVWTGVGVGRDFKKLIPEIAKHFDFFPRFMLVKINKIFKINLRG